MEKANDYFALLEVSTTASKEDVQRAFMTKALIWHPDKAPNDEQREEFSKVYERLQDAYRVLSNDKARKQYMDAKAATFQDMVSANRDTAYHSSSEYRKSDGTFDEEAFNAAFQRGRDTAERQKIEAFATVKDTPLSTADFMARISQRDMDTSAISSGVTNPFAQAGLSWDVNTFNRAFDEMRKRHPANELEAYEGAPAPSRGVQEFSDLRESGPMSHGGADISDLIRGGATNVSVDIRQFHTGELYGVERRLTARDMNIMAGGMQDDRQRLMTLQEEQFEMEPSEVEREFSELFRPAANEKTVEGLEAGRN